MVLELPLSLTEAQLREMLQKTVESHRTALEHRLKELLDAYPRQLTYIEENLKDLREPAEIAAGLGLGTLPPGGVRHFARKRAQAMAATMRRLVEDEDYSLWELAKAFGISVVTVRSRLRDIGVTLPVGPPTLEQVARRERRSEQRIEAIEAAGRREFDKLWDAIPWEKKPRE